MLKKEDIYVFNADSFDVMEERDRILLYCNSQCDLIWANETGMAIINKLDGNNTIEDVVMAISKEYNLPEGVVKEYTHKFIKNLIANKLIFKGDNISQVIEKRSVGISRVYLEVASDTSKRPLLETKGILEKILMASEEKEILLFLNGENMDSGNIYEILSLITKYERFLVYIRIVPHKMDENLIQLCHGNTKVKFIIPLLHSNEQQNDLLTHEGYFQDFFKYVGQYVKESIICYMGLHITDENKEALKDLQQQAFDAGMSGVFLDDYDSEEKSCLEELYQNNTFLNSWKNNRIKRRDNYFSIIMYKGFCQNNINRLRKKKHCGIGWEELYITMDNRVYPCHRLNVTNLSYESLDEYFKNREKDFGEQVIAEKCKDCFAWSVCLGGCKAKNILSGLEINSVADDCEIKERNIKKIFFGE